ncbi:MAG: thiamine-phosphate kinase [Chitinispirillia bacterium]|nr:thiamine-phosphate kinase [Chitinispirillia bacterium]MCL2241417.1 thiamine-phosphate kinase [Chitinispirillia bacterium]
MNKFPSKEYELIRRIQQALPPVGTISYEETIGDDAAVRINRTAGERLVITADVSVENVHFSVDTMTFEEIGYKSMAGNLSDCAAMGAAPDSAVVQLVFPKKGVDVNSAVEKIYAGFARACVRWDFPVVGGDLSGGDAWTIGITLIGSVPPGGRILKRTGIVDGDALWVTGVPGESAAGLAALVRWGRDGVPAPYRRFVDAHISPVPRIGEGKMFAACQEIHAMMDLSDGLSKDVGTLCYDNGLGFVFDMGLSPPAEMINLADEMGRDWRGWFYHGGEEYELLIACDPSIDPREIINNKNITRLGYFTSGRQGMFIGANELISESWDHCNN